MIKKAAIVVVSSVPFGYGNLSNLESALDAVKMGIRTYVIDEVPLESRDFTAGKATALMAELKKQGAIFIKQPSELPTLVNATHELMKPNKSGQLEIPGHTKNIKEEITHHFHSKGSS
jgi:iron complex transport system ATP-binding protein